MKYGIFFTLLRLEQRKYCILLCNLNVSNTCKKLERLGFIYRVRQSEDERIVSLSLTEHGRQALENIRERAKKYDPILRTIPKEKFQVILNGFSELNELFKLLGAVEVK